MPKGPQRQKRPADAIGLAVLVGKIATGELKEPVEDAPKPGRRVGGLKGGKARAANLTPEQRAEIARVAAQARWKKT